MGYRSYGRMVLTGEKDRVLAIIADLKLRGNKHMHEALDEMVLWEDNGEAYLALEFNDWKWYPDYPDIQAFEAIWDAFREAYEDGEDKPKLDGAFIRVGEDDDDVERRYFGDDPYDLVRSYIVLEGVNIPSKDDDLRSRGTTSTDSLAA